MRCRTRIRLNVPCFPNYVDIASCFSKVVDTKHTLWRPDECSPGNFVCCISGEATPLAQAAKGARAVGIQGTLQCVFIPLYKLPLIFMQSELSA